MSRTGPEYVESEAELFSDIDRKLEDNEISQTTYDAFVTLYEFANEIGDDVYIGETKNANFSVRVDAHSAEYSGTTSVFTATVNKNLQIWPAKRPLKNNPDTDALGWDMSDYKQFERAFTSLSGADANSTTVSFEKFASNADIDQFKEIVNDYISNCE
jgi:hypothetical protein